MNTLEKNKITRAFLYTALWTEELDGKYDVEDFLPSAVQKAEEIIKYFLIKAPEKALLSYFKYFEHDFESQLGHDIWLSINGHGAGFFDHPLGGNEDILQQVCRDMRDVDKIAIINNVWVTELGHVSIE